MLRSCYHAVGAVCRVASVPLTTESLTFPFLLHFFQNSLIKRIKGENVYVKHSNLMLEVGIGIYQCMSCVWCFPFSDIPVGLYHDA